MKVIHVINGLGAGGAEMVVHDLLYNEETYEGLVYNIGSKNQFVWKFESSKIRVIQGYHGDSFYKKLTSLISFISFIIHNRVCVVHAHMYHALIFSLVAKLFSRKFKLVFTSHNYIIKGSLIRKVLIWLSKPFRDVDVLFSKTQFGSMYREDYVVIPNGIAANYAQSTIERRQWKKGDVIKILMVGRLEEVKNHKAALEMIAELKSFNVELHVVGEGYLRNDLLNLSRDLDIADKLVLHGLQDDVRPFYMNCDLFLITSFWEGLPISLLEAAVHGMPVITSNVGSIGELISDETMGWIGDQNQMYDALVSFLADSKSSVAKGKKLKERVLERNNIVKIRRLHREIYE